MEIFYLYGLINEGTEITSIMGIDGYNPVFLLGVNDLRAVVSKVPYKEFNEEALMEKSEDPVWLTEKATVHMEIIQQIHTVYPVIPVKFNSIFNDEAGIVELLQDKREEYLILLNFIKGKDEYIIKVYINDKSFNPPELIRAKEDLEETLTLVGDEEAHALKNTLEKGINEKREELIKFYSSQIREQLLRIEPGGKINRNLPSQIIGKNELMIINSAFLIERERRNEFSLKVEDLAFNYKNLGINFELSGPWPPYNFN